MFLNSEGVLNSEGSTGARCGPVHGDWQVLDEDDDPAPARRAVRSRGGADVAAVEAALREKVAAARIVFMTALRREDLDAMATDLFDVVGSGKVKIEVNQRYRLADAGQAHADLEARKTTGSSILLP